MKLLLDGNLSPKLVATLSDAGHDVVHVRDLHLQAADDPTILETASTEGRVLISADTDFSSLLARRRLTKPSLLLIRRSTGRRASQLSNVLLEILEQVSEPLEEGSVIVLEDTRIRIRKLPIL
jgi:predicted nuclease of predicted toxin-antitoxin system